MKFSTFFYSKSPSTAKTGLIQRICSWGNRVVKDLHQIAQMQVTFCFFFIVFLKKRWLLFGSLFGALVHYLGNEILAIFLEQKIIVAAAELLRMKKCGCMAQDRNCSQFHCSVFFQSFNLINFVVITARHFLQLLRVQAYR